MCLLLTATVASLPLSINISSYFIIACTGLWLLGLLRRSVNLNQTNIKHLFIHFFPVIIALAGLIHTVNFEYAFDFLTRLSSFLVFPLILSSINLERKQIDTIHLGLLGGGILTYFYCLFLFLSQQQEPILKALIQENTVFQINAILALEMIHPTYLSMYFLLCLFWLLERQLKKGVFQMKVSTVVGAFILLLLMVFLAAKMPLAELALVLLIIPCIYLARNHQIKQLYGYLAGLTGLLIVIIFFLIKVPNRAVQDTYDYYNYLRDKPLTDFYSYEELGIEYDTFWFEKTNRIVIWKNSLELVKSSPLVGFGTGDVQDELIEVYKKNKELWRMQFFNSHNQYLDYQLRYGIAGSIFLVVYMVFFFSMALKHSDYLYMAFILMIGLAFLSENIIQRHWGIVFFALFNSLYFYRIQNRKALGAST